GAVTHGHGWLAVVALVAVAGVSGLLSARGDIGSVTGLQLLVYTSLGAGPIGALRPVWHTAAGFLAGVVWALILILPGWLHAPYGGSSATWPRCTTRWPGCSAPWAGTSSPPSGRR
ncbi:MAG TPA: hypothetical protein VID31_01810, partial [Streptosporangiaceae bacterium]